MIFISLFKLKLPIESIFQIIRYDFFTFYLNFLLTLFDSYVIIAATKQRKDVITMKGLRYLKASPILHANKVRNFNPEYVKLESPALHRCGKYIAEVEDSHCVISYVREDYLRNLRNFS